MIEKGRISPFQLAILMHPTVVATAALSVPSITMKTAGIDMWMTPIIAALVGILTVVVMYRLYMKFPDFTFIQYTESILGIYAGKALSGFFILSFIFTNGIILREYGEFVIGSFLQETPMALVIFCMVAVCAYALYAGIEVLARVSQILVPAAVLIIFTMLVLMIPDLHPKEMFPILGDGLLPPLVGSLVPSSWFSQFFLLSFLYPLLNNKQYVLRWSFISVGIVMITLLAINLTILLIFGSLATQFYYAFLIAVRYISIADFLEHVESLLMAIWIIGMFVKVALLYYATVLGTAQWLGLSDYRPLIIPIGFLISLFSFWVSPNFEGLMHALGTTIPFLALIVQLGIPTMLLIVAAFRKGQPG
ncbi:GerAB/ArcD/ProY family transporter [Paenibacillus aceris]|uniref:Spore germination protein KB n=1 Tax=Paenibacillus aceris TaxID=869555 RepID=A0ABS4HVG0_9BACL|nr:endospore germination permease [Paenibacillus aceris]MBP1962626.1 spore germination protein KB [Paenibacillus aceris]NHW37434.1 endospore germination permease [Paenibacillus aceris]